MFKKRWTPSRRERDTYAENMREAERRYSFIVSNGAIRTGCNVTYIDKATCTEISGAIINDSYGKFEGQHTFTILQDDGNKRLVKGRNLYDRLISHTQGKQSKLDSK